MGRKVVSRKEVLASMNSGNFRIDRIKSTQREIDHAESVFLKLRIGQLENRIQQMKDPFRLIAAIRVASALGMRRVQRLARQKLNVLLDVR